MKTARDMLRVPRSTLGQTRLPSGRAAMPHDHSPVPNDHAAAPPSVAGLASVSSLIANLQPRLHQAMAARYGPEIGHEAADEAVAWALANPDRIAAVEHPLGYLCRVAQSKARPSLRWLARRSGSLDHDRTVAEEIAPINPELVAALGSLSGDQRTAVMLVHAYGWTIAEVAAARGLPVSSVTNHLRRGLARLRKTLRETDR